MYTSKLSVLVNHRILFFSNDCFFNHNFGTQIFLMPDYRFTASERFMRYVQVDTQSDPLSNSHPTTEKQKDLSRILEEELKQIGIADAEMDEYGYVYGTIPSNTD